MAPRVGGILETALHVDDPDRSSALYERVFGFEPLLREEGMVGPGVPGGQVLPLFRRGGSVRPSPTPGGVIPAHDGGRTLRVCFAVPLAELNRWREHLREQGVMIRSEGVQAFGDTSLHVRDPDGHSVEVAVPGPWQNY